MAFFGMTVKFELALLDIMILPWTWSSQVGAESLSVSETSAAHLVSRLLNAKIKPKSYAPLKLQISSTVKSHLSKMAVRVVCRHAKRKMCR